MGSMNLLCWNVAALVSGQDTFDSCGIQKLHPGKSPGSVTTFMQAPTLKNIALKYGSLSDLFGELELDIACFQVLVLVMVVVQINGRVGLLLG